MSLNFEWIARLAFNLINAYRINNGHRDSSGDWDQQDSIRKQNYQNLVQYHIENPNSSAQEAHDNYVAKAGENGNTVTEWNDLPATKKVELALVQQAALEVIKAKELSPVVAPTSSDAETEEHEQEDSDHDQVKSYGSDQE